MTNLRTDQPLVQKTSAIYRMEMQRPGDPKWRWWASGYTALSVRRGGRTGSWIIDYGPSAGQLVHWRMVREEARRVRYTTDNIARPL